MFMSSIHLENGALSFALFVESKNDAFVIGALLLFLIVIFILLMNDYNMRAGSF